ncbi:MAG: DUF1641 domain-containing protein [Deltaproteobacteria bacterium]|nr:DUF1641 domain-containing protein [Deltaproteobacteria bacterium]
MSNDELILERLARIEEKLERVSAMEEQLGAFANSWDSLRDLGRDLSLLMDPSVKLLTEELAEVETGFQLEDALFLLKRLLLSFRYLAWSLEQLENLVDWWQDMEPMLKVAVPHFIDVLEDLEQKGIFRGYQAMLSGYAKIAQHYSPEDIDAISDGFVRMHGLVMKFSDPKFTDFLSKLAEVPGQVNLAAAKPVGPLGLPFRLMGKEYKQGLGVLMEITRALSQIKADGHPEASP